MKAILTILFLTITLPVAADQAVYRFPSGPEFYDDIAALREKYGYVGYSLMEDTNATKEKGYIEVWIDTPEPTIEAMKKPVTVSVANVDENTKEETVTQKTLPVTFIRDLTEKIIVVEKEAEVKTVK